MQTASPLQSAYKRIVDGPLPPLQVRPFGRGLFWIASETGNGHEYLVDLDDPEWKTGRCDCPDFRVRIEAVEVRGEKPDHWCCKHCVEVCKYINETRKRLTEVAPAST